MELLVCGLCQLQVAASSTASAQLPLYHPQTDSLKLSSRRLCKACHGILTHIEQFASHHTIRYLDPQFRGIEWLKGVLPHPRPSLQQLYANSATSTQRTRANSDSKSKILKRFSQREGGMLQGQGQQPVHPYVGLVIEQLKTKNLLCLSQLPRTLQVLVHLSGRGVVVSAQERKEKVKNIVMFLSERIHLSLQELPYVLVLVNFLLCCMDISKATAVVVQLSDILLAYPHLLSWKLLLLEQDRPIAKSPLSPASLDLRNVVLHVEKLWVRVEAVVELGRRGEGVLHEGLVRLGKLQTADYKEFRKRLAEVLKPLLAKREDKEELSPDRLAPLYLMKLERNGFAMILKSLIETDEEIKQEMAHLTMRHKREKDEFIDQIVRLQNRIEELEGKIGQLQKEERSKELQLSGGKEVEVVEVGEVQNIKLQTGKIQMSKMSSKEEQEQIALQSILSLTGLTAFNEKHLGGRVTVQLQGSVGGLTRALVGEVCRLQQGYQRVCHRIRQTESQKDRLLQIVSRKDDRFISVITEKDVIIQRYQQALWRMENGLDVEEEPLAHRIRYIMHIFGKRRSEEPPNEGKAGKDCRIY